MRPKFGFKSSYVPRVSMQDGIRRRFQGTWDPVGVLNLSLRGDYRDAEAVS